MIYCKHCGKEMGEGQSVCLNCGMNVNTPIQSDVGYCYNCGAQVNSKAAICTKCGFSLTKNSNTSSSLGNSNEKLARSADGKILAGVFSGLGKKWNINPWVLRGISIFLNFVFIGWFIDIAYIIAIFALPLED